MARQRQADAGHLTVTIVRGLTYLLVFSFFLPELRVGFGGFIYPPPCFSIGETFGPQGSGLPWLVELIIISMFLVFAFGVIIREIPFRVEWPAKWVFLMGIIAFLVIPLSEMYGFKEGGGAFGYKRFMFESIALFWVVSSLSWSPRDLYLLIWLFIGAAVFHAIVVCLSAFAPNLLPRVTSVIQSREFNRYAGLFQQPSRYSMFVAMGFALLFSRLMHSGFNHFWRLAVMVFLLAICGEGVILGQTRAVNLAIVFLFFQTVLMKTKTIPNLYKKVMIAALAVSVILIITTYTETTHVLYDRINHQSIVREETVNRGYIWPIITGAIIEYPLGTGYDTILSVTGKNLAHAHNAYLEWIFMFGIPGGLMLLYFLMRLYQVRLQTSLDMDTAKYLTDIYWALSVFLLCSMAEPYFITNLTFCFWLLAGVMISFSFPNHKKRSCVKTKLLTLVMSKRFRFHE